MSDKLRHQRHVQLARGLLAFMIMLGLLAAFRWLGPLPLS